MANVKNNCSALETQRKLLEAAGEVFAEHGFHRATIKEITDRAGASIASVNYHFNDKAELYAAVIKGLGCQTSRIIPPQSMEGDAETRFLEFVRHVAMAMLGRPRQSWERVLMAREFAQPSPALESMFKNVCLPLNQRLSSLICELTGRDASDPQVGLVAASIVAQCVYCLQHQSHIDQLHQQLEPRPTHEQYAQHIARFSLAGLESLR